MNATQLQLPVPQDPTAHAYKDWLHLNVFHAASGTVGLINAALHGPPTDARSRVTGTALLHHPKFGWVGNVDVSSYSDAEIGPSSITSATTAVAVGYADGQAAASVRRPDLAVDIVAEATSAFISYGERLPLGSGWISWNIVPRLRGAGWIDLGENRLEFTDLAVYHDRNWGRWHWGDDFGWQWGCFLTSPDGPAVVFSRTTDKAHSNLGIPTVHVVGLGRLRRFHTVDVASRGTFTAPIRRVPGALAALHQDRRRPRLPSVLRIDARMGADRVTVEFALRAAAQIIAADPITPGYSFITELVGAAAIDGVVDGAPFAAKAMGVFEHVD